MLNDAGGERGLQAAEARSRIVVVDFSTVLIACTRPCLKASLPPALTEAPRRSLSVDS